LLLSFLPSFISCLPNSDLRAITPLNSSLSCRWHDTVLNFKAPTCRPSAWKSRTKAQTVSRRPLTAEARVRSWVSPCGICGGQTGAGIGLSPSTSVFPCQFHSTGAPLHGKMTKN
jgi:hypothetical protein